MGEENAYWDSKISDERALRGVLSQVGVRDSAVLRLLYHVGLSPNQVSAMEVTDAVLNGRIAHIRVPDESKTVELSEDVASDLAKWLGERGKKPGPLFVTGNPDDPRRLSAAAIRSMVTRKSKWDALVVSREVDEDGRVYCYDRNGRLCWDTTRRERVVLVEDLRRCKAGLHIGQLGWTRPGGGDGYKWVPVEFDNGVQWAVQAYALKRVLPERAEEISEQMIARHRGTIYDADPSVAEKQRRQRVYEHYSPYVGVQGVVQFGSGPEELYAFTFPSLTELAELKGDKHYPVKIGYTRDSGGAVARVAAMMNVARQGSSLPEGWHAGRGPGASVMLGLKSLATVAEGMGDSPWVERAGFPERAELLLICGTRSGRELEVAVHRQLREMGRQVETAVGKEWFRTNAQELAGICRNLLSG